jgi:DNA-binding transcriptional MerR regulator
VRVVDDAARLPQTYSITDMCRAFVVTGRALRHYEGLGLLAPRRRGLQRIYDETQRDLIEVIVRWRNWRLPLNKIRRLLDLRRRIAHDPDALHRMHEVLSAHLEHLKAEQASLAGAVAAAEAELRTLDQVARHRGRPSLAGQARASNAQPRRATA